MKRELFRAIEEPVLPQPGDHQHVGLADAISKLSRSRTAKLLIPVSNAANPSCS
jgi:hypothetical protein